MACKDCKLRCKNHGKEDDAKIESVPEWCPCPEVKYPDTRGGGDGISNYNTGGMFE